MIPLYGVESHSVKGRFMFSRFLRDRTFLGGLLRGSVTPGQGQVVFTNRG